MTSFLQFKAFWILAFSLSAEFELVQSFGFSNTRTRTCNGQCRDQTRIVRQSFPLSLPSSSSSLSLLSTAKEDREGDSGNLSSTNTNTENDTTNPNEEEMTKKRKREKVMSFLRKIGAVGTNKDFTTAIGVDEGPMGKNNSIQLSMEKTKEAYKWCTEVDANGYGVIDDMSEPFPSTSSGSEWAGFTDQVMGGISKGICTREVIDGKPCNLMKGKVSLYNNGGFIQMATALSRDPAQSLTADASKFSGVELDVLYKGDEPEERFNLHLRNSACLRQFSSYRGTFTVKDNDGWQTVKIPFREFVGYGPGSSETPFDASELRRLGIVAIGKAMEVYLAVAGGRIFKK